MTARDLWNHAASAGLVAVVVMTGLTTSCAKQKLTAQVYCGPDGQLTGTASIQSHRSYCVRALTPVQGWRPGVPTDFAFDIVDDHGATLREFKTVHEKILHFIVVRHDLTQFQHVHPVFSAADGRFTVRGLVLPSAGPYRFFADFAPAGGMAAPDGMAMSVTVPIDLTVGEQASYQPQSLAQPADSAIAGDYEVRLTHPDTLEAGVESRLTFVIRRAGAVVSDLEPYLGAHGHAVVLREGDLAFIHSHAVEDSAAIRAGQIPFMVDFAEPGRYRMFVQFQHRGAVQTVAFTLPAVADAASHMGTGAHTGH